MKILLLSGGIDSTALATWMRPDIAYTIDYGQLAAEGELRAATTICEILKLKHRVLRVDCGSLGSGDLSRNPSSEYAPTTDWWPFRNQLLITLSGMAALQDGGTELWLGSVASDRAHSDGSEAFYRGISRLMRRQIGGLRVRGPAVHLSTLELIDQSGISPEILAWCHSCHTGPFACGTCRGCTKRREIFEGSEKLAY